MSTTYNSRKHSFSADIIYHLFDQFTAYMARIKEDRRRESAEEVIAFRTFEQHHGLPWLYALR
jgi:hypothetical protein